MTVEAFLKLAEIRTKIASMVPFIAGLLFAIYRFNAFDLLNSLLFFLCLISLDMFTTVLNNYMDYKKALLKEGYGYEEHNAITAYGLTLKAVEKTMVILFAFAMVFGFILFLRTSVTILLLGMIGFFIAASYSFGPAPINRSPYGEIFSGLLMGGLIFFVSCIIQMDAGVIIFWNHLENTVLIRYREVISVFAASIPFIIAISNIMLSNNICDVKDDIENKRYTLVTFIGRKNASLLFSSLYIIIYVAFLCLVIFKVYPWYTLLLVVLAAPLIFKNVQSFVNAPSKAHTFKGSVNNLLLIGFCVIISLLIGILA